MKHVRRTEARRKRVLHRGQHIWAKLLEAIAYRRNDSCERCGTDINMGTCTHIAVLDGALDGGEKA